MEMLNMMYVYTYVRVLSKRCVMH